MKISIIIPSYMRCHLLNWDLFSLSKQNIPFEFETIILNDGVLDYTEKLCAYYKEKLNIRYFFTGQRNLNDELVWRTPGFAINIGVKQSQGDITLICCAEMFHINNTIKLITDVYTSTNSDKILAIPKAKDDNGRFLQHLKETNGNFHIDEYNNQPPLLNVRFPFFIAMKKKEFMDIGGYDEDFTGTDYDDNDIIDRLTGNNCTYVETQAEVIHLWHQRHNFSSPEIARRFKHNQQLYLSRKDIIIRNVDREWGVL